MRSRATGDLACPHSRIRAKTRLSDLLVQRYFYQTRVCQQSMCSEVRINQDQMCWGAFSTHITSFLSQGLGSFARGLQTTPGADQKNWQIHSSGATLNQWGMGIGRKTPLIPHLFLEGTILRYLWPGVSEAPQQAWALVAHISDPLTNVPFIRHPPTLSHCPTPSWCFWDHLPNKQFAPKSLFQGLLLGEIKLRPCSTRKELYKMLGRSCGFRKLALSEFPMMSDLQDQLCNLWGSVQNKNVGSFVELLLRISR